MCLNLILCIFFIIHLHNSHACDNESSQNVMKFIPSQSFNAKLKMLQAHNLIITMLEHPFHFNTYNYQT
jgi:hypothetical protein